MLLTLPILLVSIIYWNMRQHKTCRNIYNYVWIYYHSSLKFYIITITFSMSFKNDLVSLDVLCPRCGAKVFPKAKVSMEETTEPKTYSSVDSSIQKKKIFKIIFTDFFCSHSESTESEGFKTVVRLKRL